MSIQTDLELALEHHKSGRFSEAEAVYREVLAREPSQGDALHLLGVLAQQTSRAELAVELISHAVSVNPGAANYYVSLINALAVVGRFDDMIACAQRALALQPDSVEAQCNLADSFQRGGRTDDAIALYRELLTRNGDFLRGWNNLGSAYSSQERRAEALDCFQWAVTLKADFGDAHFNIANIRLQQGRWTAAIEGYRRVIAAEPQRAEAYDNLGIALSRRGELQQAIDAHRLAIAINPNYAWAYNNLGAALTQGYFLDASIESLHRAVALKPDFAQAYNNLGNTLRLVALLDESCDSYERAMKLAPADPAIHSNYIYALHYKYGVSGQRIRAEQSRWNELHGKPLARFVEPHKNDRDPDRRLRIGYVSADFRDHVAGRNLLPLLWRRDRAAFEVFCYSNNSGNDVLTERYKSAADAWREIASEDDARTANMIREDQIDILIDLSLHSAGNRLPLFARKPAPIQLSFVGYPASTGLDAIDWRLSDPYLDPIDTEGVIRLRDSFWCYDAQAMDAPTDPVDPLPATKAGHITFGCLNNPCKINDAVLGFWAKVMHRVEGSRLIVLTASDSARIRLLEKLQNEGVDPFRMECIGRLERADYFKMYNRIDLGFDTLPYNGHTTSLDSYWMGVPVVTLVGEMSVGRAGWSQLCNLDLKWLAAQTPEKFVQIAVDLANDRGRLADFRAGMRDRMSKSPLCDLVGFTRDVESAYRRMWRNWCAR